jgi:hypothetical protein
LERRRDRFVVSTGVYGLRITGPISPNGRFDPVQFKGDWAAGVLEEQRFMNYPAAAFMCLMCRFDQVGSIEYNANDEDVNAWDSQFNVDRTIQHALLCWQVRQDEFDPATRRMRVRHWGSGNLGKTIGGKGSVWMGGEPGLIVAESQIAIDNNPSGTLVSAP